STGRALRAGRVGDRTGLALERRHSCQHPATPRALAELPARDAARERPRRRAPRRRHGEQRGRPSDDGCRLRRVPGARSHQRRDRIERAYRAIVNADAPRVSRAEDAIRECYANRECRDELLTPHVVGDGARIEDGDAVVFFNFRPDRARQLTWALLQPDFNGFARTRVPRDLTFVSMTDYKVDIPGVLIAFPHQDVIPMAQILADAGLTQFHTAETEKYAHVTYFFNGGREKAFAGED